MNSILLNIYIYTKIFKEFFLYVFYNYLRLNHSKVISNLWMTFIGIFDRFFLVHQKWVCQWTMRTHASRDCSLQTWKVGWSQEENGYMTMHHWQLWSVRPLSLFSDCWSEPIKRLTASSRHRPGWGNHLTG